MEGQYMEIKYNQRSYNYPSIIKGLLHEISKKDFDHFHIVYSNDNYGNFYKNEDKLIEFRDDHLKETCENGDVIYWDYENICKIKVTKNHEIQAEEEKDVFDDNDLWTGNRIQF